MILEDRGHAIVMCLTPDVGVGVEVDDPVVPRGQNGLMTKTPSPRRQSTPKADKQVYQEDDDEHQQDHEFDIFPPHAPLQRATPHPEIPRILPQATRLIDQRTHVLAPLQHPLNILRHNLPDALDLALGGAQGVLLSGLCAALLEHHLPECAIEAGTAIRGQVCEIRVCGFKLGQEFLLEVGEEAKGDALA